MFIHLLLKAALSCSGSAEVLEPIPVVIGREAEMHHGHPYCLHIIVYIYIYKSEIPWCPK